MFLLDVVQVCYFGWFMLIMSFFHSTENAGSLYLTVNSSQYFGSVITFYVIIKSSVIDQA